MDLLEDQGHGYILGLPGNARLSEIGQPWCEDAALRRVQSGKDKVRRFFQTGYPGQKLVTRSQGRCPRRGHRRGTDVRFVVTNLPPRQIALREGLLRPWPDGKHDQGAQALHQMPTAPRVTDGKPTSSGCSCTIGCCISCAGPRPAARRPRRLARHATVETLRRAFLKIAVRIEKLNTPSRSPCPPYPYRNALIAMAASMPPKAPDPSGACRRMNLERQSTRNGDRQAQPGRYRSPRSNRPPSVKCAG